MENQRMQKGNMAARNNRAMQSSEVFIRLDISMLNSYDMMLVREKYGIEGWGVVVFIMKYLIERRTDCRAPLYAVNEIARICHKRKNSVLQLIMEFPSLFEIEANGKIFFSPYLLQFFGNSSANEKQTNHSLDKLTNETLDNQKVSFPKNKNKEQEQITTKEKKRKGTSPSPSQGGECDADGRRLREIGGLPRPLPRRGERRRREEAEERGKYNGHAFGNILCHETTEDTGNGSAASDRTNGSCPTHTG